MRATRWEPGEQRRVACTRVPRSSTAARDARAVCEPSTVTRLRLDIAKTLLNLAMQPVSLPQAAIYNRAQAKKTQGKVGLGQVRTVASSVCYPVQRCTVCVGLAQSKVGLGQVRLVHCGVIAMFVRRWGTGPR